MKRRRFICAIAVFGAYGGVVEYSHSQRTDVLPRVGVLLVAPSPDSAFARQLQNSLLEAGYTDGRNLAIEWRTANGDYARVTELIQDLVLRNVDVLVIETTPAIQAAKKITSTIPIVMTIVSDPLGSGLVSNLARPGGNVTGLSAMSTDLASKRLQILKETLPRLSRVAVFWNPSLQFHAKVIEDLKAAAQALSIQLSVISVNAPEDLDGAFSTVSQSRAEALYVIDSAFFAFRRKKIIEVATKARVPVFGDRAFVDGGALMSYGPNFGDMYRRAAGYVAKILKGAKAGDLPIEQPAKFDLVVNLNAARDLGIEIPQSIVLQANEVIR